MITSHPGPNARQNYGYFSRSWSERHHNSVFVVLNFWPVAALRAELIRFWRVSGPGLSAGALLWGAQSPRRPLGRDQMSE